LAADSSTRLPLDNTEKPLNALDRWISESRGKKEEERNGSPPVIVMPPRGG
jgi:hypothetical protein